MNQCYGCETCQSADKPLESFIAGLPMETSHHRVKGQSVKCGFGLKGSAAACAPMVPAESRRQPREVSAAQRRT